MNDLFENLYHSIHTEDTEEMKKLLCLIEIHKTSLNKNLDSKNTEILHKLSDCIDELQELYFRENFKNGFKLGIKIAVEFFCNNFLIIFNNFPCIFVLFVV